MNQNSKTDLITLTHPFILLSIFVLLINDHVLKIHFSSALTGKVSDFAGLFFFPILLSAILHFVLKPFKFESRNIAFASFGFTTIFFSLIKTVPFFNDFIEELFSIQIILDPSDLIALIMLPLAWRLRDKIQRESKNRISNLSYVVLGIASLVALASSPAREPTIYYNLIVHENVVYAEFNYKYSSEEQEVYYLYSKDGGITWQGVDFELQNEVAEQTEQYSELPFTLCLPDNSDTCYQTGNEVILESSDSGQTWVTSWEFPLERSDFYKRRFLYSDLGPYDLVNLELNGKQIIIASMGSEGVLVKTSDNEWKGIQVSAWGPVSFGANNLNDATTIINMELYTISISTFIFLLINVLINSKDRSTTWNKRLITYALVTIVALFTISIADDFSSLFVVGGIIFVFAGILTLMFTFEQLNNNTNKVAKINLIPLAIVTITSYCLFILWAYGTIPSYETAEWIAISLYILLLLWILYLPIKEFIQTKISHPKRD